MYEKTIIIIGNGPSLKGVDFSIFKNYDTFAMNVIYRYCRKVNWWPMYFGCFDLVVTKSHAGELKKMIEDVNLNVKLFFLLEKISDSERLITLDINGGAQGKCASLFGSFTDWGNTGCNCCQMAICMGYKKLILIGIDCNYQQELVDGAHREDGNVLRMLKTPNENPNYFIDDYQQEGDMFYVPNQDVFHKPAWKKLAIFAEKENLDIVNCGSKSTLDCFRKSTLEEEMVNG